MKNLVFNYNQTTGDLIYKEIGRRLKTHSYLANVKEAELGSHKSLAMLNDHWGENGILKNMRVAQVSYVNVLQGIHKAANDRFFVMPCNLDWNSANSRRFAVSLNNGKCLRFIASSTGDIFVVFATNPNNEWTWYFFQISSYGVALYKAGLVVKYKLDSTAGSLKDDDLFRRFFVCINYEIAINDTLEVYENYADKNDNEILFDSISKNKNTKESKITGLYLQYGIVHGYDSKQVVHLSYFDEAPLEPRFYMFGR
jgi:hypothetical protein